MAERISGIALFPRVSRNGVFYDIEELAKFDGKTVPLRVEHDQNTQIGEVTFSYDRELQQVKYEASISDEGWKKKLDNEQYQVSIGASVLEQRELCDSMKEKCLNAPVLKDILELSVVKTPGIPESSLHVIESSNALFMKILNENDDIDNVGSIIDLQRITGEVQNSLKQNYPDYTDEQIQMKSMEIISALDRAFKSAMQTPTPIPQEPMMQPQDNTSNIQTTQTSVMTDSTKIEKSENVEEKVKVTIETDGEIEVGKASAPAKEEAPVEKQEAKEDISEKVAERIEKSNSETIKAVIQTVKEAWSPKSEVAESADSIGYVEESFSDETAKAFLDKVFENGYGRLVIDKEGWIETHTTASNPTGTGAVHEAVSTSGTIPGVKQSPNVSIQIGSKTVKPIRQFGQFASVPTGQNTARFYRITVPDAGAITESPTTDITATTHTLTSIDVTCNIRGWRQVVEKAELEDYPASFLNAVRETARLEAIRDEHRLIVQDLAGTDHDFGGVSTAPYHIGGSDGAATTNTTEEDADGEFDEDGLTFAKRYLEELGQDTSPGNLVAFLSPRAFESLMTSTNLSEYTQIGNANITRLGQIERLYGIDIVITNELLVQNNAYRNLVCVKGKSFALASQRNMEIELQKQIAGQYWDIVWTHRIGVDVLDPNTYVIVSSVQA